MASPPTLRILAAAGIGLLVATAATAQPPPPTPPDHPAIEQVALDVLKAASQRLAAAKALSFTALTTYEHPAATGQPLYYSTRSEVVFQRPDRLRVITPADGPPTEFYYDGKVMIAYDPAADLVAVAAAPPTLDAALKQALQTAAIYFPFSEILVADPYANISEGLKSAFMVGQSKLVGDTTTDIVAIASDTVQAEIWIGTQDGLPRQIRTIYPKQPGEGRIEVRFSNWQLDGQVPAAEFTTPHAATSPRMPFARPDAAPPAKQP